MSRAEDKDVGEGDPRAAESPGKVEFDSRGKAIWRWARDKLDSTSVLLKRLENKNLALEPTQKVPVMRGKPPAGKASPRTVQSDDEPGRPAARDAFGRPKSRDGGGGFDPYNSR